MSEPSEYDLCSTSRRYEFLFHVPAHQYRVKPMVDRGTIEKLAQSLVETNRRLLRELVEIRKENATQAEMAERMLVSQPTVAAFERYDANPTLASIERYALAAGASIDFRVENAFQPGNGWERGTSSTLGVAPPPREREEKTRWSALKQVS